MFNNRLILFVLGFASLFLAACDNRTTESDTTEVTYTLEKNEPSVMFWDYAASTGMLQTTLGKLAKEKSEQPQVVALADSSLFIYSKALRTLRSIAGKYEKVQLPDSLTGADKAMIEEFKLLEGEEFNARYLAYLEQTNSSQLERYQEALSETEDPALRKWLNNMKMWLLNQQQHYAAADTSSKI